MTLSDIKMKFRAKLDEIGSEHEQRLLEHLKENNLDGIVIRISDGKEGRLVTDKYSDATLYHIDFYPIKKDGKLSTRADGYILSGTDLTEQFRPKEADT